MAEYDPSAALSYDVADDDENEQYQYDPQDADEEDDDYDPSNFNADESADDARSLQLNKDDQADTTTTATPLGNLTSHPKTVGGFIVDDDDEEELPDANSPASQSNDTSDAQLADSAAAAQDIPIASEAHDTAAVSSAQNALSAPLNGSAPVISQSDNAASAFSAFVPALAPFLPTPTAQPTDEVKQTAMHDATASASQSVSTTPQPPAISTAAPPQTNGSVPATPTTKRLPHDKVGQLEDRITEDPRGDTDAWRTLIAHYREKGQFDQARKVYERFFKVFPSAVCIHPFI